MNVNDYLSELIDEKREACPPEHRSNGASIKEFHVDFESIDHEGKPAYLISVSARKDGNLNEIEIMWDHIDEEMIAADFTGYFRGSEPNSRLRCETNDVSADEARALIRLLKIQEKIEDRIDMERE